MTFGADFAGLLPEATKKHQHHKYNYHFKLGLSVTLTDIKSHSNVTSIYDLSYTQASILSLNYVAFLIISNIWL